MELEELTFLTSDYTTKLQSSRQYGTSTKPEIETNGTREPRDKPIHLQYLSFDKGGKNIQWGKDRLFNKWYGENWTATSFKRMKLDHYLILYTKINSKWIIDLNLRPETVKLLEENIGRKLDDINQSKIFQDPSPRVMEIKKTKINKQDLIKCESFCTAKETTNKMKRQPSEWEKIIANETTDED